MAEQPRNSLGQYLSPGKAESHLNFDPAFGGSLGSFLDAAKAAGHSISIYSGYRSPAHQKSLFDKAVQKYGSVAAARKMVAPPGKSRHNKGIAADLRYATPEALAWAHANAKKFGLNFRMSWENWHIEPDGTIAVPGEVAPTNATFDEAAKTREQAKEEIAQAKLDEQKIGQIAQAYQDPMRALDTIPSAPPSALNPAPVGQVARAPLDNLPSPLAPAPVGQVTRAALPDIPSALAAAPVGLVQRASLPGIPSALAAAPVGRVERAALQPANIAPSGTMVASLNAAPVGKVERGPALSPTFSTAGGKVSSLNAAPVGAVERGPALAPATPQRPDNYAAAGPKGNFSVPEKAAPPSTATLASQYSQYRSPTSYAGVKSQIAMDKALEDKVLAEMEMDNLAVPALAPPAPTVAAPPLAPPTVVKNYPVYQAQPTPVAPPAPPAARAYDVYSGMARSALDNTGMNTVGRLADGTTTVTNQYGKTTGMTPGGYQTAVGSGAISGPLGQGGIQTPSVPSQGGFMSKAGSMAKAAMPSIAGSTLGGLLGGPMGAILGAALARWATKPGGILSGMTSFDTNAFGTINAAKAVAGGRFPGAPSNPGTTRGFKDQATRDHAYGMSPGAAAAIDKGLGGLY